ncbi:hypothetical protein ACFVW8_06910 [Streptomyces sp. NPDC058221]|uniref:hypothetical protein n=1 Tax=Streptomyces sp. NPDC058221 TaxID=3346388 RepID=UPI0036E5FB89
MTTGSGPALPREGLHSEEGCGCGVNGPDESVIQILAVERRRVRTDQCVHGGGLAGNPWSMIVVELIDVIDGKIARKRTFFVDPVRLRTSMIEREAALKDPLPERYGLGRNLLLAMHAAGADTEIR